MLELISQGIRPYYWRSGNSAEVDFIFEDTINRIISMEAKSADNTRTKSFVTCCKHYKPAIGFRVSMKNLGESQRDATHEISLPLYLLWKISGYTQIE